jgi:opacity protein-like surface antigen
VKKIVLSIVCSAVLFCVGSANAQQGVKVGQASLSLYLGINNVLTERSWTSGDQGLGDHGISLGTQFIYNVHPHVGLGAEFGLAHLGTNNFKVGALNVDDKVHTFNFMPVAKFMFRSDKVVPYGLVGVGLNSTKESIDYSNGTSADNSSVGLALALGIGMDYYLHETFFVGMEGRWSYATIDKDKFNKSSLTHLTLFLKGGVRFG